MAKIVKIFIGGGGDDWISHIVETYAAEYSELNPGYEVRYFSWTEGSDVRELITQQPEDAAITVVGHSYGGDTAFFSIRSRVVDVLVSIDPVARFKASWDAVRPHAKTWLNVRAEPKAAVRTFDDTIAAIGGKYPRPPSPGSGAGAPNHSFFANQTHGAFRPMMRASAGGISGQMLLGGNHVA